MKRYYSIIYTLILLLIISCKKDNFNGIVVQNSLLSLQTLEENRRLENLVLGALNKDVNSIIELKNFPNGGGASGYDLGYIITQIIYRIGENEFSALINEISSNDKNELLSFITVGLAYGDNNYDGKIDNLKMNIEFPKLYEALNNKN